MQDKRRIHSDLKWLIASPDFLSVAEVNLLHNHELLNAGEMLQNAVIESDGFIFEPTHRLGVYFEQLWHHLVRSNLSLKLLRSNQQVIINKHTLGEFDSIIQQLSTEQTCHFELAVKFYLQIGHGNRMADWVGPNLRDRFDRKFLRLINHQLALASKPEVQQWLREESISIDQTGLFTKGRLFYSMENYERQELEHPAEVESDHLRGFWMTHHEFQEYQSQSDYDWFQLPRMYWLSDITAHDLENLGKVSQLSDNQLVKLVAMKEGKEMMRGFVVTDEWLERAKQRVLTEE
ncbi:DUF1853 family protein [Kangiella koreensis]|uniref:DUF1853 family protein n=1 Tax=Kangiella koreensis (strain DSM 16069 / JCM 12317 / KCTC 12182 / SW-125) TaxID=523791 RepID=C7R7Y7_KANKD|nr:DUF1853 family protein [Kangiella koreensis]ACV25769.1 Domain of unknown function DUF1853 [Kangiella koreensis DSM 16069]